MLFLKPSFDYRFIPCCSKKCSSVVAHPYRVVYVSVQVRCIHCEAVLLYINHWVTKIWKYFTLHIQTERLSSSVFILKQVGSIFLLCICAIFF